MQHVCSPDHGLLVMAFCSGGILGILTTLAVVSLENRNRPPPGA